MTPEERVRAVVGAHLDPDCTCSLCIRVPGFIAAIRAAEAEAERRGYGRGVMEEREACARLHEDIDCASDEEHLGRVPGAGAMGAVLRYKDAIRGRSPP